MNFIKTIECLDANIAEAKTKLKEIENYEVDPYDLEDEYCAALNDEPVHIGGLTYDPADVLKAVDPTAYRCGLIEYADLVDRSDTQGFKDLLEDLDEIRDRIEDATEHLEEMRDEDTDNEDPSDESIEETLAIVDAAIERGTEVLGEIDSL